MSKCVSQKKYGNNAKYEEKCCLAPGTYTLNCKDSFGDGWHGGYIEIGGTEYCQDFNAGKLKSVTVNFNWIISIQCQIDIVNIYFYELLFKH